MTNIEIMNAEALIKTLEFLMWVFLYAATILCLVWVWTRADLWTTTSSYVKHKASVRKVYVSFKHGFFVFRTVKNPLGSRIRHKSYRSCRRIPQQSRHALGGAAR